MSSAAVRPRSITSIFIALGLLLAQMVIGAWPAAAHPSYAPPDRDKIDAYLSESLAATRMAGMAVAIVHDSDLVQMAGYGIDSRGSPVTAQTRFRLASLSKAFTAVAVHQLADSGRIDLNTPIQSYLPAFDLADHDAAARIRVRDLLQQRSGLADSGYPQLNEDGPLGLEQRVESLHSAHPVSMPGTEFHYFDPNYQVLARLVEKTSGESFESFMAQHVFQPLGMADTVTVGTSSDAVPGLVRGHLLIYGMPVPWREQTGIFTGTGLLDGSSGVVSTAEDLARWLAFHNGDGSPLVSGSALQEMHTPPPNSSYAEGWVLTTSPQGERRLEHSGVLATYSAIQMLIPGSGFGFVLLFNGNSMEADTAAVASGLAELLSGRAPSKVRDTRLVAIPLAVCTVGVLAWRASRLVRIAGGPRRPRRWLRFGFGAAWLLLPIAVIVAAPAVVQAFIDRVFTREQYAMSMPDVAIFLLICALTGVMMITAQTVILLRSKRPPAARHPSDKL